MSFLDLLKHRRSIRQYKEEAVSKEDYESAARYRDEIRALKAKAAEGRDEKGGRTDEPMV